MKKFLLEKNRLSIFLLALLLWTFSFREFLFGKLALTADAISYYDHLKFIVDNVLRDRVFPLWDASWYFGMPNDFFLRRLNPYNPLLLVIFVLKLLGIKFAIAYVVFLMGYFFLGLAGFYRCVRLAFQDQKIALTAFLLLLFSPLGTRLFDSYILLIFTPLAWFMYFLLAFHGRQEKHFFLGLILTMMFLLTTYIPFYSLVIISFFIIPCLFIYPGDTKRFLQNSLSFARKNKVIVALGILLLALTVLPGLLFFLDANRQEIVLPARHSLSLETNVLAVDQKWVTGWGALEEIFYASYFPNLENLHLAVFYIPVFFYVLLLLGVITAVSRKTLLLFLWGAGLFLLATPKALPLYALLYKHIFFFKYFKNLQFFLWLGILPIFTVFLAAQWRQLIVFRPVSKSAKIFSHLFLALVHLTLAFLFFRWGSRNVSTYLGLGLSWLFFTLVWTRQIHPGQKIFILFAFALIALQPLDAFHQLTRKNPTYQDHLAYDQPFEYKNLVRTSEALLSPQTFSIQTDKGAVPTPLYVTTARFNTLYENIPAALMDEYVRHKFIVYDSAVPFPDDKEKFSDLIKNFRENQNLAYLDPGDFVSSSFAQNRPAHPWRVEHNSPQFQLLAADANTVRIKTNFPDKKFLVYVDNFHSNWQAWVNAKKRAVVPANIAFKGIWLDPGEQILVFRFGSWLIYVLNFCLFASFYAVFVLLLMNWKKHRFQDRFPENLS